MKNFFKITFIAAAIVVAWAFTDGETDKADCLQKSSSAWGKPCDNCPGGSKDSYTVTLKNTCSETLDVMVCVQESDKSWKKAVFHGLAPKDSVKAYACVGTGKYLKFAKKTGDTQIVFPSLEEITKEYK